MPNQVEAPIELDSDKQYVRGMWIWNTAQLVEDNVQIDSFVDAAEAVSLTDAYLYVAPEQYEEIGPAIAAFNTKTHASGIRVWALDGDPAYISNLTADEALMVGLQNMIQFNERVPPAARFYGFQADIEPQDTPPDQGDFHAGIAESNLTALQQSERDIRIHIWINCLTRVSNFLRSYDMPFGAVMPYWLHGYQGEPVTGSWSTGRRETGKPDRTCMMDMAMPLVDQYVIKCSNTEPAETVKQIMTQVRYACDAMREGRRMPTVLGSVETAKDIGTNLGYGDLPMEENKAVVLKHLDKVNGVMTKYPAFGGMVIHDWTGWKEPPPRTSATEISAAALDGDTTLSEVHAHTGGLDKRLNVVLQKLEKLKSAG